MARFSPDQVGVSTNLLHNPEAIVETVELLSRDFIAVEIELENAARGIIEEAGAEKYADTVERLNALREERNLRYSVHAPYIGQRCDLASADGSVREGAVDLIGRAVRFARDIGATKVTYHPGYVADVPRQVMMDRLRRSLDVLVPLAEETGIVMCIENTGDERPRYIVLSREDHLELCRSTGTRLTVDLIHTASFRPIDRSFYEEVDAMLPYTANIHFADMKHPKHIHLPIGAGTLPLDDIFSFLAARNYRGNAIVEERGGQYVTEDYLEGARRFRDSLARGLAA